MKLYSMKYVLILKEPGKDARIVWTGTKKECEKKKLDLSFDYNTEWLVVEEKEQDVKELKLSISGFLGFTFMCGLMYIYCIKNGKKIYISD